MTLAEYLEQHELTDEHFANQSEVGRSTVTRLRNKRYRPSWDTIDKIEAATKGAVTAADYPLPTSERVAQC